MMTLTGRFIFYKMGKRITEVEIAKLARIAGYKYSRLRSVVGVESSGNGFLDGRLVIQFEPHKFSQQLTRKGIKHTLVKKVLNGTTFYVIEGLNTRVVSSGRSAEDLSSGVWQIVNGVEGQSCEYKAFSKAFAIDPDAAMKATSIGMMQVMGEHYASLGFKTVGEMWEFAKVSEYNQIVIAIRFIKLNKKMDQALKDGDFETFSFYYNGKGYKAFKYDTRMAAEEKKYKASPLNAV